MIDLRLGNCLDIAKELETCSVQTIVTSPPYWGLRSYGVDGQWGLERTPEEYVCHLVELFRELRRALKDDGTIWVNLGDSYATQSAGNKVASGFQQKSKAGLTGALSQYGHDYKKEFGGIKQKDLVGIPWRVAFALQADGWYLRSDIIWHKPNPMPESVTDRPTKSHEYIFLLSKSAKYYYDADAVREKTLGTNGPKPTGKIETKATYQPNGRKGYGSYKVAYDNPLGRNRRTVWTVTTRPFKGAHFATFPEALIEPCILAGTSAKGECPKCGAAWVRVVERTRLKRTELPKDDPRHRPNTYNGAYADINGKGDAGYTETKTLGWEPQCACGLDPVPQIVLDPFNGAGTTGVVAKKNGRRYIGIELNPEYLEMARDRLDATPTPLHAY